MSRYIAKTAAMALLLLACLADGAQATPPTVSGLTLSSATTESARLEAQINPNGKALNYQFQYGPLGTDCTAEPAACITTSKKSLLAGSSPVLVAEEVKGLAAGTAYHFRVVAVNALSEATTSPYRDFMTYLPPQEFGPCPNDFLRKENPAAQRVERQGSTLPDCRAYEQATPIEKGGGDVTGTVPFERAAGNGNGIVFLSASGLPGGKGSQEFPAYLASREGGGWTSRGMLPPAKTGQRARVLGWTPDFADVYARAALLGEPQTTTFLRSAGAGGPLSTIADYAPETNYLFAGAADDGSVVLYETGAKFGESGVEGASQLYAWERASDTLAQVDVFNDGASPANGAFAGSYDWVNGTGPAALKAGGALRDYYTQDQHALATDGSAAYFTEAGAGQLYARLNPTQAQSALDGAGKCTKPADACTLHASASKKTNGTGEGGGDPAGVKPAAFMAASADGSKAFFTSTEKLTNDANTGPEQEPAAIVRSDKEGKNRLNCTFTHAQAVAVDSEHIYWIDLETGAIGRAKIDCTEPEAEFIAAAELEVEPGVLAPAKPRALAVANGHLYWANAAREEGEGAIGRGKLNGAGAATEIEQEFIKGAGDPQGVAVDAGHVYWTNSSVGETGKAFIGKAKADGGEVNAKLIDVGIVSLAGIAVDAEHVYWMKTEKGTTPKPGRISRARLDGSEYLITFVFLGISDPEGQGLAVEGTHIYWATQGFDLIGRAKLNGEGAASEVEGEFVKGAGHPRGLAVDATHLYWTANAEAPANPGKDLYLYDAKARTLEDLAPDSSDEDGAEVRGVLAASADGSYVYFAANGVPDGTVGSPNPRGEEASAGDCPDDVGASTRATCNLYLWHEGEVRFVARLEAGGTEADTDAANWTTTPTGVFPGFSERTARISADGKTLLFRSQRQLSDYENEGKAELYRFEAEGGQIGCVSCNPTGGRPAGQARFGSIRPSAVIPGPPASTLSHNLTADGKRVFFETTDALVGEDTNGEEGCPLIGSFIQKFPACLDVYEWEAEGTGSCEADRAVAGGGCFYLLSTGKGKEPALIADASRSGDDVFFFTRSRLAGQDEDSLQDVYDARAEGGLAAQNQPPPPPSCESTDSCHPHGPQPAEITPPPSFSGPGNPKGKKPGCPKGKHRVKGRCVKRKAKKHRHHKRKHAQAKGRGSR